MITKEKLEDVFYKHELCVPYRGGDKDHEATEQAIDAVYELILNDYLNYIKEEWQKKHTRPTQ